MTRYVLAFRGGSEPETQEQAIGLQAAWASWLDGLGPALIDAGGPFGPSRAVSAGGAVTDGGQSGLSGFSIVIASGLDEASALAATSPIFAGDGEVDVYEILEI